MVSMRGVALGGFMGVGKSTVGRLVAAQLGWTFVDSDTWLTSRYGPIPAQFAEVGEAAFREREREALGALSGVPHQVLATGGGAWVDPRNRSLLRQAGLGLVVLTAPFDVLAVRVGAGAPGRPLFGAAARSLYEARQPAYREADVVVSTAERPPEAVAEEIVQWIGSTSR